MRAPDRTAYCALMSAAALTAAGLSIACGAQPAMAQQTSPDAQDDTITITPDMDPRHNSRTLGGSQDQPPRGPSTIVAGPPTVLAILAHPDDEITIAPVLSRISRGGGAVTIIFATSGDAGPGVSGLEPGAELAALREDEARCSAFALGLPEPVFWRLGDGTLAQNARAPESAARGMEQRIAALIALHRPQTVMTWGPDGGYGHADHRMVSNTVTQIIGGMDDGRPDLLYAAFPSDSDISEGSGALPGFENWAVTHPSLITDRIRYEPADLDASRRAIDCYESQFTGAARAILPSILHENLWKGTVYFRLAFQSAPPGG